MLLSCSVMSDPVGPYRLQSARLLGPWDFPGKNTGVGCHFLLYGISPTQGSNPHLLGLLHWQVGSLPLAPPGKPRAKDVLSPDEVGNLWKNIQVYSYFTQGFSGGSDGKESACNAGDLGLIPGLGICPGGGHGNPLQYSCLENPMDIGARRVVAHSVAESDTAEVSQRACTR